MWQRTYQEYKYKNVALNGTDLHISTQTHMDALFLCFYVYFWGYFCSIFFHVLFPYVGSADTAKLKWENGWLKCRYTLKLMSESERFDYLGLWTKKWSHTRPPCRAAGRGERERDAASGSREYTTSGTSGGHKKFGRWEDMRMKLKWINTNRIKEMKPEGTCGKIALVDHVSN